MLNLLHGGDQLRILLFILLDFLLHLCNLLLARLQLYFVLVRLLLHLLKLIPHGLHHVQEIRELQLAFYPLSHWTSTAGGLLDPRHVPSLVLDVLLLECLPRGILQLLRIVPENTGDEVCIAHDLAHRLPVDGGRRDVGPDHEDDRLHGHLHVLRGLVHGPELVEGLLVDSTHGALGGLQGRLHLLDLLLNLPPSLVDDLALLRQVHLEFL
mmetsp:Transcript_90187/g.215405  ORF Transcript_90187/g.215405 Transcript_90187/m.215405 type:complete len:211 (-) Transcript_90187:250-882(-)